MTDIVQFEPQRNTSFALLHQRGDSWTVTNRLNTFFDWCNEVGIDWMNADLADYRDTLLEDLAPRSVEAHLSTLRQRIRDSIENNKFQDMLREALWHEADSPADLHAKVQMILGRIGNMVNPRLSRVSVVKNQELADSQRVWLNGGPDAELREKIMVGKEPLQALRDRAIVELLLTTGIRAQELCDLIISDLYESYQGHAALRIRAGKGNKQRLVVYGDLTSGLKYTEEWLLAAHIHAESAYIFRGFWTGYTAVRKQPMTRKTIHDIIYSCELSIGRVSPHALRRTYARMCYNPPFSMRVEAIQKNMGHTSPIITMRDYIGDANVDERIPRIRGDQDE